MARATLAAQTPTSSGLSASYTTVAQADGAQFANTGRETLHVKNPTAGPITLTAQTPVTIDGDLAVPDRTINVPAGGDRFCRFVTAYYNQSDNNVYLDVSADGLQMAVLS